MHKVKTDLVVSVYGPGGWIEVPVYRVAPPRTGLTVRLGVAAMLLFLCLTFAAVGRGESGNAAARTTVEGSSASAVVQGQATPPLPDPASHESIGWILAALAAASAAVGGGLYFFRKESRMQEPTEERHVSGGPVIVEQKKECVDRAEHLALVARLEAMEERLRESEERQIERMDEHFQRLTHERSVSIARLHERIEATQKETRAEVDAKTESVRREVHAMPATIVQLLRDTGAIQGGRPR